MVDRITPATTDADRQELHARFGIQDRWPVLCEPFVQWVLEDSFTCGRPPYERAGVQLVEDVEPYELMKLRLVNCSHQGMCYFGRLCGYELVHDAAADPLFEALLRSYMDEEATPTLPEVPGIDLQRYKQTLIERLRNPEINDTIARLATDGSDRLPKWLLPVVRQQLATGGPVRRSAAIVASWARYMEGIDEHGQPIEVVDRRREPLMALAKRHREDPLAFVSNRELFGDLVEDQRFVEPYLAALDSLHDGGARATLQRLAS
jgi:mannitol 2-dehydrogenase